MSPFDTVCLRLPFSVFCFSNKRPGVASQQEPNGKHSQSKCVCVFFTTSLNSHNHSTLFKLLFSTVVSQVGVIYPGPLFLLTSS